jgi:hypothetical protein
MQLAKVGCIQLCVVNIDRQTSLNLKLIFAVTSNFCCLLRILSHTDVLTIRNRRIFNITVLATLMKYDDSKWIFWDPFNISFMNVHIVRAEMCHGDVRAIQWAANSPVNLPTRATYKMVVGSVRVCTIMSWLKKKVNSYIGGWNPRSTRHCGH